VDIGGIMSDICNDCPSPTEVYARAAALRETWPPWRLRQAYDDERHGPPVCFDDVVRIGRE
jgi:hypothetical protein